MLGERKEPKLTSRSMSLSALGSVRFQMYTPIQRARRMGIAKYERKKASAALRGSGSVPPMGQTAWEGEKGF